MALIVPPKVSSHFAVVASLSLSLSLSLPLSTPPPPSFSIAHIPYVLVGAGTASFSAAKAIREKDPQVIRTNMQKL